MPLPFTILVVPIPTLPRNVETPAIFKLLNPDVPAVETPTTSEDTLNNPDPSPLIDVAR